MSVGKSQYSKEFRDNVVKMVLDDCERPVEVAKRLGLTETQMKNWLYLERKRRKSAGVQIKKLERVSSGEAFAPSLEDYRRMEREVRRLTQERDILKKPMAYFVDLPK